MSPLFAIWGIFEAIRFIKGCLGCLVIGAIALAVLVTLAAHGLHVAAH